LGRSDDGRKAAHRGLEDSSRLFQGESAFNEESLQQGGGNSSTSQCGAVHGLVGDGVHDDPPDEKLFGVSDMRPDARPKGMHRSARGARVMMQRLSSIRRRQGAPKTGAREKLKVAITVIGTHIGKENVGGCGL
jgi:hypothetical protein